MSDPFIGEVHFFPYTFVPYGWAACDGALLPVIQQQALYALINNQFGGTPGSNFNLPDLRSRAAVGASTVPGPGLTLWANGTVEGQENVGLTLQEYPAHSHSLSQLTALSTAGTPTAGLAFAQFNPGAKAGSTAAPNTQFSPSALAVSGQGAPHENRQPSLALLACIALDGIFPAFP